VEEVAEWESEEIDGLRRPGLGQGSFWPCVYLCVWMGEHIVTAFGQVNILLCIISAWRNACVKELERCYNIYPLISGVLIVCLGMGIRVNQALWCNANRHPVSVSTGKENAQYAAVVSIINALRNVQTKHHVSFT
jgi:hypothetical protein